MASDVQTEQPKKGFAKRALFIILMAIAALVLAFAVYNIVQITSEDSANEHTMQSMREFVQLSNAQTGELVNPDEGEPGLIPEADRVINFTALQQVNPEIVAWIYIPDTNVDYPVTRTDNNDYYLTHGPDLEENRAGSIFLDTNASPAMTDLNTIIYGHRMNNGSMFGSLYEFENADYFNSHRTIYVYTPDGGKHEYRTYAVLHSSDSMDAPAYRMDYDTDEDFIANSMDMMSASMVPVNDVSFSGGDKILTLSTCVRDDGDSRLILQAKAVED